MRDFVEDMAPVIIGVAILLIVFCLSYSAASYSCSKRWSESGLESKYVAGGCLVRKGDKWIPEKNLRELN